MGKLTAVVGGSRRIVDRPPLIVRPTTFDDELVRENFAAYLATVPRERRILLERYQFVDVAKKVVGVGSVGTRCWIALFEGRDEHDPLILQIKEATSSVLEPHLGESEYGNHGERVVVGQRLTQAASDIFLGWMHGRDGRDYYWRQLWDMKSGVDPLSLNAGQLRSYSATCGWALARAHAKTGDRVAIAAYIGSSARFPEALADFAAAYATQAAADYQRLQEAEESGRIEVRHGL